MPDTTARYLTLRSETVHALPDQIRAELLDWLKAVTPDADAVYRVTFDPHAEATTVVYVTELERDDSSHFLAHVRMIQVPQPVVPAHLQEHFEPCDDFL